MKQYKFEIILGSLFFIFFLIFWCWHSPIKGKLNQAEINRYLGTIENNSFPPEQKTEILARLRSWAEADDGKPVFMLNLIRNYDQIRPYPGSPEFQGTPEESNKLYEKNAMPLLFKRGCYPQVLGIPQGKNLLGLEPAFNNWSEVIVVRYKNRRAFLSLLADPVYGPIMPYKLMASQVYLTPLAGAMAIPDLRWIVGGGLLIVFFLAGWFKAVRGKQKGRRT